MYEHLSTAAPEGDEKVLKMCWGAGGSKSALSPLDGIGSVGGAGSAMFNIAE